MKIAVLNYQLAAEYLPTEPTSIIRIFDPGCYRKDGNNHHNILKGRYEHILSYAFEDIDLAVYDDISEVQERLRSEHLCFTSQMAEQLVREFAGIRHTPSLVVHCNAGISRSVAVAHAFPEALIRPSTPRAS